MTDFGRRVGGETDHGALDGLADDDHAQYHNNARGDARYLQLAAAPLGIIFADMYKAIIQGTYAYYALGSQNYHYMFYTFTAAQNDEVEYEIFSPAGTKTLQLLAVTSSDRGIITFYLDDVSQGTIDLYSASIVYNVFNTLSVTVVGTKVHSLKLKMETKNGSSSNYVTSITFMRLY